MGGAEAAAEGSVNGAPVAGDVSMFAGEEEGVLDGFGHAGGGLCAAYGDVAISATGVRIGAPVVGFTALEEAAEVRLRAIEDVGEGAAAEIREILFGSAKKGARAWAANPAGEGSGVFGMRGPPDRGKVAEAEEKAECAEVGLWRQGLPEALAEDEGEAADGAHAHVCGGFEQGAGPGDDADGAGLEDAEWKCDDGFGGDEFAGGGLKRDVACAPTHGRDGCVEEEGGAGGAEAIGQEVRQTIVALADVGDTVSIDGVFGGLLDAERLCADLCGVSGVETLDVANGGSAEVVVVPGVGAVEKVAEAKVGSGEVP